MQTTILNSSLKIQILCGKTQNFSSTFQLAYTLQNHTFDMAVPDIAQSNDVLLIQPNRFSQKILFAIVSLWTSGITNSLGRARVMKFPVFDVEPITSPWACEAFYVNKHASKFSILIFQKSRIKKWNSRALLWSEITLWSLITFSIVEPILLASLSIQHLYYWSYPDIRCKAIHLIMKGNHPLVTYGGTVVIVSSMITLKSTYLSRKPTILNPYTVFDKPQVGTLILRPKAYKAWVGGISPRCGIEQILED